MATTLAIAPLAPRRPTNVVNKNHLILADGRGIGFCIYGPPGMRKTLSLWSAPPPILVFDFEGGTSSLLPWIRRARNWNDREWTVYPQTVRDAAFARITDTHRKSYATTNPGPLIDVIHYENQTVEAWSQFVLDAANIRPADYNTVAIDSIKEYSEGSKTFSRGVGNEHKLMNDVPFSWVGAQERSQQIMRKLRDLRANGVFVVLLSQQDVVKEYVFSPMSKDKKREEPYSVQGTVNAPGQLANAVTHIVDVLMHARVLNAKPCWVAKPEPLPGGSAWWDGKDRYGALPDAVQPNFYTAIAHICGTDGANAIYSDGYALVTAQNAAIFQQSAPAADPAIANTNQPVDATEPTAESADTV